MLWLLQGALAREISVNAACFVLQVFNRTTELHGHGNAVISMAVHPTHKLLFSSSLDKTIRIWELTTFTCVSTVISRTRALL